MQMYKPNAYMYKQQFTVFKIKEREKFWQKKKIEP